MYVHIHTHIYISILEVVVHWAALLKVRRRQGSPRSLYSLLTLGEPRQFFCIPRQSRTEQLVASAVVKGVRVTL